MGKTVNISLTGVSVLEKGMKSVFALSLLIFSVLSTPAWPQNPASEEDIAKGATGLPLPRFASLHSDLVNLRTGPGTRYPIEWVYVREGLPVEITKEFDIWRRIRDWEGSEGWVHKSALSGKRMAIITGGTQSLHKDADAGSETIAKVEAGAIGRIESCEAAWCELKFNRLKGYMPKTDFWGTYQDEVFR